MNKYICTVCGLMFGLSTYAAGISFTDVTESVGLARQGSSFSCAVADFNRDGYMDLAVSTHGSVLIYRNNGRGEFEDITGGGEAKGVDVHGITWIDYTQNGMPDLFVCCGGNRGAGNGDANRILINQQGQGFKRGQLPTLLEYTDAGQRSMLPVNLGRNGMPDIVLMSPDRPGFKPIVMRREKDNWSRMRTGLDTFSADSITTLGISAMGKPLFILQTSGKNGGAILQYEPDGTFLDVSAKLGVEPGYKVMRVVPFDYDNDGDLDLYYVRGRNWVSVPPEVVNDRDLYFAFNAAVPRKGNIVHFRADGRLGLSLFVNSMKGTHKLKLGSAAVLIGQNETEVDVNDPRLTGKPEAFASEPGIYLWKDPGNVFSFALVGKKATPYAAVQGQITAVSRTIALTEPEPPLPGCPNRLYENRGGRYVDVTAASGVGDAGAGADAVAADFDNDGDMDIYVINGTDSFRNVPNVFYCNNGDGTFEDITAACKMAGPSEGRGDSVAVLDADNDGDMDIFYANGGGPAPTNHEGWQVFLRNETKAVNLNWCRVEIENPYGVLVTSTANGRVLAQIAGGMTDRFGCSLAPVHIGLGAATQAEIEVYRPSGKVTRHTVNAGETLFVKKN
jgi:hypothetical protein